MTDPYGEWVPIKAGSWDLAYLIKPTPVKLFDHGAKEIHAGRHHSLILTMDGTLWGTGLNSKGEPGLGDLTGPNTFTQITTGVMRLADVMSNEQTVSSAANLEMISKAGTRHFHHGEPDGRNRPIIERDQAQRYSHQGLLPGQVRGDPSPIRGGDDCNGNGLSAIRRATRPTTRTAPWKR